MTPIGRRSLRLAAALLLAAAPRGATQAPGVRGDAAVPGRAPLADFVLEAADGRRLHLVAEDRERRLTVLWVAALECAATQAVAPAIGELARAQAPRGVRFLALDPASGDDAAELQALASAARLDFPLLCDPLQVVSERLGVATTATALLLDAEFREVARLELGGAGDAATRVAPLAAAIEAALAARPLDPTAAAAPSHGVPLASLRPAARVAPTFFRDVAPLLWRHCVECHRPGEIGPMSFLDGEEAQGWAPQIAEITGDGRMPPWHANPRFGQFRNERSLTETEKRTLADWAAGGAPLGEPGDAPPPPTFPSEEWSIGTPDLVLELPAVQSIPAEGVVPYRYLPVDPRFTEDRFVEAVEIRPTNRAVTHHVAVFLIPPGTKPGLLDPNHHFAGSAPGGRPLELPAGEAKRVARGSRFLFQLHYAPIGTAASDRTRMALRFAREPVVREHANWTLSNDHVVLEPQQAGVEFTRREVFRAPIEVTGLLPHMHWRGRAMRVELERGGARSIVLDVPAFDFGWQHTYEFVEPLRLAAGDALRVTATYDNSAANPRNPDPSQRVKVGEQSSDEMMVLYVDYVKAK
ncbi:MAG: redoxin domain-containing protein [Planctomycetes bacterium]|nr:redoxin domain-containing protein [Planctomycetota bacterium]